MSGLGFAFECALGCRQKSSFSSVFTDACSASAAKQACFFYALCVFGGHAVVPNSTVPCHLSPQKPSHFTKHRKKGQLFYVLRVFLLHAVVLSRPLAFFYSVTSGDPPSSSPTRACFLLVIRANHVDALTNEDQVDPLINKRQPIKLLP